MSRAATKCISLVPGLVKQVVTPASTSVRIIASAPFMAPPSRTAQALIDTTEMATEMTMTAAGAAYDIHRGSRR